MMTSLSAPASAQRGRLPVPSGPAAPRRTARPGQRPPATPGGHPRPAARPRPAGTPGAGRGPAPPPAQRPRTGRRSGAARSPATTAQEAPRARPSGQVHMASLLYRKRFCRLQHAEQGNCSHPWNDACPEPEANRAGFFVYTIASTLSAWMTAKASSAPETPARTSLRSSREPRTERPPSSRATARPWPLSSPSRTSTHLKMPSTDTLPGKQTATWQRTLTRPLTACPRSSPRSSRKSRARALREVRVPVVGTGSQATAGHSPTSRADDLRALTPLGDDPRRPDADVKKLAGYEDRYRLRAGDYRVIYEVMDGQLVILVVGVGHRREIYRAMS